MRKTTLLLKRLKRAALLVLLLTMAGTTKSLAQSTVGTDFWVTFLTNNDGNIDISLIAAGSTPCTGIVTNPYTNWSTDFEVSVGATTIIEIPLEQAYSHYASDDVINTGLHVVTTDSISLYASNFQAYTFDVTDVLPTPSLGSNYIIQTYPGNEGRNVAVSPSADSRNLAVSSSEFTVVAVEDNTTVYFNLTGNSLNGHYANQPFSVTLNAGQCYQVMSESDGNLTGSQVLVSGNKNVAVFAGNSCANVPTTCPYCDHIVEQMMPVSSWGNHFVVTNSSMRSYDEVRVTAANNNCQIFINGSYVTTINQKQTYQFEITDVDPSMYLETSEPAVVYLYYVGSECAGQMGDPSMVMISPIEQRMNYVTFSTFNSGASQYHYVNVVTNTDDVSNMYLDGNNIVSEFQTVSGNEGYSFARIAIEDGSHTLLTTGVGFVGHVYGLGDDESYAYSVGSNALQDLYTSMLVNGQYVSGNTSDISICTDTVNFDLNLNYNLSQVNWTFGDGETATGIPVTHIYPGIGDYSVSCDVYKLDGNGNDSLVATLSTVLHIHESFYTEFEATAHNYFTWEWMGETYFESGDYVYEGQTLFGCDSIVTLHLTITHEITASANPEEGGVVAGGGSYNQNETCTLTATANEGYSFMCWTDETGSVASLETPYTFVVTQDATLTANFVEDGYCGVKFDLYDSYGDGWNGNYLVVNYQDGTSQALTFSSGSSATYILPIADGSHVSLSWITGSYVGECSFSVNYLNGNEIFYGYNMSDAFFFAFDMDCEGMPTTPYYDIYVTSNPYGYGSANGGGTYRLGQTCTLTATPYEGYSFVNWTNEGTEVSTESTFSFTVTNTETYTANFEPAIYTITVTALPTEGGMLNGGGTYAYGETCTLQATPNYGYSFLWWAKDNVVVSTDAILSFAPTESAEYVANFMPSPIGQVIAEYYPDVNNTESQLVRVYWDFIGEPNPHHYRIYRSWCEGNASPVVIANEVTDTQYIDDTWQDLVGGHYKYGVSCIYENGRESGVNWAAATAGNKPSVPVTQPTSRNYTQEEISCGPAPFVNVPKHTNLPILTRGENTECIVAEIGSNFGHFTLNNPSEVVSYGFYIDDFTQGACYKDGIYYFSNSSGTFGSFHPEFGLTVIATGRPYGQIEYNPVDGKLYGLSFGSNAALYEVNPYDGSYVELAYLPTSYVLTFTITNEGRFIICDAGDNCIKEYDFATGELVPLFYVDWNINYGQDMAMDRETNEVYWAACNATESTHPLFRVNLVDNTLETIGYFENQVAAFANATFTRFESIPVWSNCIEKPLGEMCELVFDFYDSYGDGWNGNYLVVNFEDGTSQELTFSSGSSYSQTLLIETGSHVTLSWITGSWTGECSFTISYADGTVIYEGADLNGDFFFEFVVDCVESPASYTIIAEANPVEGGTVSGGGTYAESETCTLTATANEGYTFVNWTKGAVEVSTDPTYTFTVTEAGDYVANFALDNGYHWDVNVSTYPNTMTMVGVIEINGVEQMTTTLEIGAFCGDECRGRERLVDTYYQAFGHYFVFLTVYGNDNDQINFRLYDHAIGEELNLTCSPLVFQTNGLFGNPGTPYVFDFSMSQITQSTDITLGWNWWSTYVEADDLFDQLKTGLGANAQQIKSSTSFVNYYGGMWIGGLTSINNESCYLINANNACTLEMTGNQAAPADHPITINPNWNWIGYPNSGSMSVANAFSNFTPSNGDQVKSQNSFSTYYSGMWVGGLQNIIPGMGLLYKSNSTGAMTLIYPEVSRSEELVENVNNENNHWTADYHAYPSNMTVMAVIELDEVELQGENYEIAAFANGECRGSARLMYVAPINRYIAFLTVSGEDAAELNFGLYNAETSVVETQCLASLTYATNAIVGSLETPYVIRFRSTTGMDEWANSINVFPNPVNSGERFSLGVTDVETLRATSVQIINALGMVVETQNLASPQSIAAPKVAGVYTLRITVEGKGTYCRKLIVK